MDENAQTLSGMSFVVTGSLNHYASRNDLKEVIEEKRRQGHRQCDREDHLPDQQ